MIHGGLGLIDEYTPGRHALFLSPAVLRAMNVTDKMRLYGMYYPSKDNVPGFVFTPIPYPYWDAVGRYIIRVKHDSTAIRDISAHLSDAGSSILFSEATRSGHRFDTWNLTIGLDLLEGREHPPTFKDIKEGIEKTFDDVLFKEGCLPVQIIDHTALAHFHMVSEKNKDQPIYAPFSVSYDSRDGSLFGEEFAYIVERALGGPANPQFVFGAADECDMTIRVGMIPNDRQDRFFSARYDYKSTTSSSRGILSTILKKFPNEYMIWEMTNYTLQKLSLGEDGSTLFVIEDTDKTRQRPAIEAQKLLDGISLPAELGRLLDRHANRVTVDTIRNRIRDQWQHGKYKHDIFLSYSHEDEEYAEEIGEALKRDGQHVCMARWWIMAGDDFRDKIKQAIVDSREMCILITPHAKNSAWLMMEYGMALAYGKHIAPIRANCPREEVPEIISAVQHVVDFSDLDEYVKGVLKRERDRYYEGKVQMSAPSP